MRSRRRRGKAPQRECSDTRGIPVRRRKHRPLRALIFLRVMMALCAAAIAFFAVLLVISDREYAQGDAAYEQVRAVARGRVAARNGGAAATSPVQAASGTETVEPEQITQMDFAPLQVLNADVVGWLYGEGSPIDYPVVLGRDNEYYLTHLFDNQRNKLGSLFMDYRNCGDFSDKNTVIYGHNMKDGSMFASLTRYKEQAYFDSHSTMTLYTPAGDFVIVLFAGIVADGDYEFIRFEFQNGEDFTDYINNVRRNSTFKSELVVDPDDRIVTLCTCSYDFNNARFALFGVLRDLR